MILGKDLSFEVSSGKESKKSILSRVNIEIPEGSITGIIGKNGAGKSTLVKILSGFLSPTQGDVSIGGKKLIEFSTTELALKRSVLSQEVPISFGLSVLDILLMGRYPYGKLTSMDYEVVDQVIESLDLKTLLETSYPSLSGGERQKVQFGKALCQLFPMNKDEKKVLFLDEPLSALDLSVQQVILSKVSELNTQFGLTVVFVLHDLNYISKYCKNIFLLERGELVLKGSPSEVFNEVNLKKYFNVNSKVIRDEENKPVMIFN